MGMESGGGGQDGAGDGDEQGLGGHGVDGAVHLAGGDDEDHREQQQRAEVVDDGADGLGAHRIRSPSATRAHTKPTPRYCGTRKNRSLA